MPTRGRLIITTLVITLWAGIVLAQIDHRRGHATIVGELQARYRTQPEFAPDLRPVFWVNSLTITTEPGSDLEKFMLAKVGTRITVTIKSE